MAYAGTIQPRTYLGTILKSHKALGLKVPAGLEDAAADADATVKRFGQYGLNRDVVARAVYAALAEDRDPTADPVVQAQLARHQLAEFGLGRDLEQLRNEALVAAVKPAVKTFITAWAKVVKDAQGAVTAAHNRLPGVSLSDPGAVVSLPPDDMAVWGRAREAISQTGTVVTAWTALAAVTRGPTVGRHTALILADLTADQLNQTLGGRPTPVHELDTPMSLATFDEFQARSARVRDTQQATAAADQAAREQPPTGGLHLYRLPAAQVL